MDRKVKFLIHIAIILLLVACSESVCDKNALINDLIIEVEPQILYKNDLPNFLQVSLKNTTDKDFVLGFHHTIEFFDEGEWVEVLENGWVFPDTILAVEANSVFETNTWLINAIPDPALGKYRVRWFGSPKEYWYGIFFITKE